MFVRKVKVKKVSVYRDGGTIHYVDAAGESYFEDHRIGTQTKGQIFDKHPSNAEAIGITVDLEVVSEFSNIATIA